METKIPSKALTTDAPPSYASVFGEPISILHSAGTTVTNGVHNDGSSHPANQLGAQQPSTRVPPSAPNEESCANQLPHIPRSSPFVAGQIRWNRTVHGRFNAGLDLQEEGESSSRYPRTGSINERRHPTSSVVNRPFLRSFIMLIAFTAMVAYIVFGALGLHRRSFECDFFVPLYPLILGIGILISLILAFLRWFVSLGFVSMFVTIFYLLGYLFSMHVFRCTTDFKNHIQHISAILIPFFVVFWIWGCRHKRRPNTFFCDSEAGIKGENDPMQAEPFPDEH